MHTKFKQIVIGIVSHGLHRFYLRQLKEHCQKYKLKGDKYI